MPTKEDLQYYQAMPLPVKVAMTKQRIREWVREYGVNGVYVSFSGGKDSTVLLHLVRSEFPEVEAVFVNTGLEYPEIQQFVKTFDNVTILRPKMRFDEVIKKYGYPIISKVVSDAIYQTRKNIQQGKTDTIRYKQLHGIFSNKDGQSASLFDKSKWQPLLYSDIPISDMCCAVMKKQPTKNYTSRTGKKPIIAQLACESQKRTMAWLNSGCNGFDLKHPQSNPMAFWTEQDVLQYIKENNIQIASVYGDIVEIGEDGEQYAGNLFGDCNGNLRTTGCSRTGCIFCAFGCHLEKEPSRFQRLKETHPRQYNYCIGGGEYVDGVWQPNKQGLGIGHVFDELNKIYGDGFIKY